EPAALTVELWARSHPTSQRPNSQAAKVGSWGLGIGSWELELGVGNWEMVEYSPLMHPDLERAIALQHLDTEANDARKALAEAPERDKTFDARLAAARQR